MAGRVLSKKNEAALRSATETLASILALLDKESESDSDEAKEARQLLQEAANLGNWLEARIHLAFTEIADNMFGNGQLTRDERIGLSAAIGAGLDAFNASVAEALPHIYERPPWAEAPDNTADMAEAAINAEFMPLVEQAVRRDGTIPIKIIAPGWGSSGYYPKEVLERDGPKVFTKQTQMFWDHPTAQEEAARPEGSLNALAAELVSDARWADGPAGPGLYADAKVFEGYQAPINDMAKHIGVSIRAIGRATQGEAEGKKGPIIQSITNARSVDFVTEPGAGGKILEMFEAARPQPIIVQQESDMSKELQETIAQVQADNARLREAMILRDARDFVREEVARATIPDVTKARLIEQLSANPPVKDGQLDKQTYTARITETVKGEIEYLTKAAGYGSGRIEGMGGNATQTGEYKQDEIQARMVESFQRLGLSADAAKIAAQGRG